MEALILVIIMGVSSIIIIRAKDKEIRRLRHRLIEEMQLGDRYRRECDSIINTLQKAKEDKVCDVPRDSIHKEASNAVGVFQSTLGLAAEIKAKRMALENKEGVENA